MSSTETSSTPPDRRRDQPRRSLQRRVIIWTVGLVAAATLFSAIWLNRIAEQSLSLGHVRTCELLAQTVAGSLAGHLDGQWNSFHDNVIESLSMDPRVAFVAVTDADSRTIFQRNLDPFAYAGFAEVALAFDGKYIEPADPIDLEDGSRVVARKIPIWKPHEAGDSTRLPRQHEGFVMLAMRDRSIGGVMAQMQTAQLVAAAVVCLLAIPVVVWAVQRWTAPLLELVDATAKLGRGEQPKRITKVADDELGLLSDRFNGMAEHLLKARAQLVLANAQLEEKVKLRTAELQRANTMLESAMRDKDEFLQAVSHDLGAPLRNIIGMVKLMMRKHAESMDDDIIGKLERINANASHQTDLIHDLLELSRIRAKPGQKEPVETEALVRDIADAFAFDLESKGITLDIASPLPVVFAERNRLRQVFQNLIDNAIKYMGDEGEKRITIESHENDVDAFFTVKDTGRGIHERDVDKVFQVFQRATHSNTHTIPGRGVGLSSVKSILQTHGGDIGVSSKQGEGTTFTFHLPKTQD